MIYITGGNSRLATYVKEVLPGGKATYLVRKGEGLKTDYSEESLKRIFRNAKAIVNIAGRINGSYKELYEANVALVERIVNAMPREARLIHISTIAVYGKRFEGVANESFPVNPDNAYGETKLKGEEVALSHKNTVVLRLATLYGEAFKEYEKMFKVIMKGIAPVLGKGENKLAFLYARDAALVIKNALRRGRGIYVVSGESIPQKEAVWIAKEIINPKARVVHIPEFAKFFLYPFMGKEQTLSLLSNRVFDSSKAKKELGFKPISIRKGIEMMAKAFIQRQSSL